MAHVIHDLDTGCLRRETNVEMLTRVMEFARCGPIVQCFVLDALLKHCEHVVKAGPAACDAPMVSGALWVATAHELQAEIKAHLNQ